MVAGEKLPAEFGSNWSQFGGGETRLASIRSEVVPPLRNAWTYKPSSKVGRALVIVDGLIYFGTLDGKIEVVDVETGSRVRRIKLTDQIEGTCAYHDGSLYVAYRYGEETLGRLDLKSGKFLWQVDAGDIASEPLVTEEGVFVSALYKHIDCYDLATGERKWRYKTADQHRSSPALSAGVLVSGCDNGTVYALVSATGALKWKTSAGASVFATPVIDAGRVFVGSIDSVFYALSLDDGKELWRFKADAPIYQSAASDGDVVVFGATNGQVFCLDAVTGSQRWSFSAQSVVSTSPLITGGSVYFGSLDTNYYALDMNNGRELWHFTTEGRIRTAPVAWGPYLVGASEKRTLYAFTAVNFTSTRK